MKKTIKTIISIIAIVAVAVSCNAPFGEEPTLKDNASSAAPIPGSYVNTFTKSADGKTLTVTIDQSTAKNISHINFTLTACDSTALSVSNITDFTANGVDVMGSVGVVEGKGNSCYQMLSDPFIKLDMGFTTPLVTLVITLDTPVMAGQFLVKSATECWGLNDPNFMFTLPCPVKKALCYQDESAWATGKRYVSRGNWATYTAYQAGTINVYAGQNKFAGTTTMSPITNGNVTITIVLNEDWALQDVSNPVKIQGYSVAPTGNPSPGRFESKGSSLVVTLPFANFYGIHLDVKQVVVCPE
jgi:hypothetical protein